MTADVLVEINKLDKTFTYNILNDIKVSIGSRVKVPFNNRILEGFVVSIDNKDLEFELKNIISLVDSKPVLNEEMLALGKYMSKKYLCTLMSCYQTMLPSALKAKNNLTINKKMVSYLCLVEDFIPKTDNQKKIKELFITNEILKKEANKISSSTVKSLINKGYVKEELKEEYRLKQSIISKKELPLLTSEQENIINKIKLDQFKPYLIHGVTGSGKTEVYMRLIDKVLKENKKAIVLVPEISLTPQLVNTFKTRFDKIALLHSGLSNGEKYDEWRRIENDEVNIVVGARSAIFAPLSNIGIIIIDEEHSQTYKQENYPYYDAKDIAIYRARTHNCPLVLGSATPSIESYTRAKTNIYELLEMKNRVNNNLPEVSLVDMKEEFKKGNTILSKKLYDNINECLDKEEQVILLLNRRGYNTVVTCPNCGFTHKCPKCDIPLTYHKKTNKMICHYCNYQTYKINKCPNCNNDKLSDLGMGTEKLQEYITKIFPKAKVIRMDIDTTRTKNAHEKIFNDFKDEKYNILIGTQMIAKGLDFPKVTLVGVLNGDASLNIPDFRSGERTFQLLNQVSGRAGRSSLKGKVVIQGFNVDNYSIIKASNNDYVGFYEEEMKIRKKLLYPPFYNLVLIGMQSNDFELLNNEADKINSYIRNNTSEIVLGPTTSSMPKINNIYYMNIIIKYKKTQNILDVLTYIFNKYRLNNRLTVSIDFNPYHF